MKILRLNRSILNSFLTGPAAHSYRIFTHQDDKIFLRPSLLPSQRIAARFLDMSSIFDEAAAMKRRARVHDEIKRGYFADISEFQIHRGKIAMANKAVIPAMDAPKFPSVEVNCPDGRSLTLPICFSGNEADGCTSDIPKVSVLCLSFRESAKAMIDSWIIPFLDTYGGSKDIQLHKVSFFDVWYLYVFPFKQLILRSLKKNDQTFLKGGGLQRHSVYSFGDSYDFRKDLNIKNRLTGYIYLLDKFGRIRWQGFGTATEEEVLSFLSCASQLLKEN